MMKNYIVVAKTLIALILFSSNVGAAPFDNLLNRAKDRVLDAVHGATNDKNDGLQEKDTSTHTQKPHSTTAQQPVNQLENQSKLYDKALVTDVQIELNRIGYKVGVVDGIYGVGTKRSIERFQSDNAMPADGIPSSGLLNVLRTTKSSHDAMIVAGSSEKPDLDVVGLRLGMSKDEAISAIEKHAKNLDLRVIDDVLLDKTGKEIKGTMQTIQIYGARAVHMKSRETIIVDFPRAPNPEKAIYIARIDEYFGDAQLSMENVKSAILKKYGEPTSIIQGMTGYGMVWVYGEILQSQSQDQAAQRCAHSYLISGANPQAKLGTRSNSADVIPRNEGCGTVLTIRLSAQQNNNNLLWKMSASLYDNSELIAARASSDLYSEEYGKKKDAKKLEEAQAKGAPAL